MNKKKVGVYFLLTIILLAGHLYAVFSGMLKGDFKIAIIIDVFILVLSIASAFILHAEKYDAEKFTAKFLIATTVQFIGFLSLIAALVVKKIPDMKYWSISAVGIFVSILVFQTTLLLLSVRSKANQ
jgi:hypothetical protein